LNWVDCEQIYPVHVSRFRAELGLKDDQKVALYAGNIGKKQGLEILLEAARLLKDHQDLIFVICGNGAAYTQIRTLGDGLPNVVWLPVQPTEKLNDLLNLADVHLLVQKADAADVVMPSKLTGMLASGRTVLATANPGTQVYDLVQKIGVVVPPKEPQLFADALVSMLECGEQRWEYGIQARRIAEDTLSRDAILKAFEVELEDCVHGTVGEAIRPDSSAPIKRSPDRCTSRR
jgi:colanic acid biosynthesis glycosyl transferase WcaI